MLQPGALQPGELQQGSAPVRGVLPAPSSPRPTVPGPRRPARGPPSPARGVQRATSGSRRPARGRPTPDGMIELIAFRAIMHAMQDASNTGLRERKKAATRLAIERAAVQIASREGYEAATAEAIAAKAGVSPRTFFNYFPNKDIAIVGRGLAAIAEDRAHRILEESGADLIKGIGRVARACAAEADHTPEFMRGRRRLIHENPPLLHPRMTADSQFENWLAKVVADHLRKHPARRRLAREATIEEEARLAVVVVSSAFHHQLRRAIENNDDEPLSEKDMEHTIDMMAAIHGRES
jgi:AcrR family transcriptional regulator